MNEIALSNDLNQIELEINHHKNIAGQSIWEIGRRLNHVKENDLAHGEFTEWVENLGIKYREANRMMRVANELPKLPTLSHLGSTALYIIASLSEEERTKEYTTDKGESKSPDEMTVRELQELKIQLKQQSDLHDRQLKEKDDVINKTYEQLKNAQNQKKEVVRETVEVVPDDYEQIKNSLNQLKSRNDHLEAEHQELIEKQQEVSEKSTKFDQLNEAIQQSQGRLNQTQKKISEYNNLHNLLKQSNEFLTKASTLIYSDISELVQSDELAKKEMTYLQNKLDRFNRDLNNILNQGLILEGEIIND